MACWQFIPFFLTLNPQEEDSKLGQLISVGQPLSSGKTINRLSLGRACPISVCFRLGSAIDRMNQDFTEQRAWIESIPWKDMQQT